MSTNFNYSDPEYLRDVIEALQLQVASLKSAVEKFTKENSMDNKIEYTKIVLNEKNPIVVVAKEIVEEMLKQSKRENWTKEYSITDTAVIIREFITLQMEKIIETKVTIFSTYYPITH